MAFSGSSGDESEGYTYDDYYLEEQMPHVSGLRRALIAELGPEYSDKFFMLHGNDFQRVQQGKAPLEGWL
jgi:hypothetical protein